MVWSKKNISPIILLILDNWSISLRVTLSLQNHASFSSLWRFQMNKFCDIQNLDSVKYCFFLFSISPFNWMFQLVNPNSLTFLSWRTLGSTSSPANRWRSPWLRRWSRPTKEQKPDSIRSGANATSKTKLLWDISRWKKVTGFKTLFICLFVIFKTNLT